VPSLAKQAKLLKRIDDMPFLSAVMCAIETGED
jgi:hypothetical protein